MLEYLHGEMCLKLSVLVHIGWSHDCLYIKYAIMGDLVHMV